MEECPFEQQTVVAQVYEFYVRKTKVGKKGKKHNKIYSKINK